MDKKTKTILIIFLIAVFLIGIIDATELFKSQYNDKLPKIITSQSWERDNGEDTERISFTKDGEFRYSCSCGSPVDNFDACDSYKYDKETKTIKLNCIAGIKTVKKIKIVESTDTKLVLDFEGEKREFVTENNHIVENPLPFAGIKFQSTKGDKLTLRFTKEGTYELYNADKNEFDYGSDVCFFWTYKKDSKEINLDCQGKTRKIEIKKYDEDKKELELYFAKEKKTIKFEEKKGDK